MSNTSITRIACLLFTSIATAAFADTLEQPGALSIPSPPSETTDLGDVGVRIGLQLDTHLSENNGRPGCVGLGRPTGIPFCSTGWNLMPEVDVNAYVGLRLDEAKVLAEVDGVACRVVRIDDETFAGTMDYRMDRLNFSVDNGIVTSCTRG